MAYHLCMNLNGFSLNTPHVGNIWKGISLLGRILFLHIWFAKMVMIHHISLQITPSWPENHFGHLTVDQPHLLSVQLIWSITVCERSKYELLIFNYNPKINIRRMDVVCFFIKNQNNSQLFQFDLSQLNLSPKLLGQPFIFCFTILVFLYSSEALFQLFSVIYMIHFHYLALSKVICSEL